MYLLKKFLYIPVVLAFALVCACIVYFGLNNKMWEQGPQAGTQTPTEKKTIIQGDTEIKDEPDTSLPLSDSQAPIQAKSVLEQFPEGETTIRTEEFGEPFISFYSLPYLLRYHISNLWGVHIFEPVSEERSGKTTYGRGKPDKISLSKTGRFIGFTIPFGDGGSIPVIYDMKSGKDILPGVQKSTQIVSVSDFVWSPEENSFFFISHFNGYSGEGVEAIYYWHEKSPETLVTIASLSQAESGRLSDASYSNLRLANGLLYVNEQESNTGKVTVKTFALP